MAGLEVHQGDRSDAIARTHINPPFLNLLANIKSRAGRAMVRVGGNTQEKAVFFPQGLAGGATILKDKSNLQNPVNDTYTSLSSFY